MRQKVDKMFIGEYQHTIDEKGRLSVPAKFRGLLAQGAVVTRGLDNCLFLYVPEEWEKLASKLSDLPIGQADARAFSRLMLAGAFSLEVDRQGRINIPQYLRDFAVIKKNVVIAGLYNRLEIWSEETWNKYKTSREKETSKIAEHLGNLGV